MREDALIDTFNQGLRQAKLRPTLARIRVLEVLQQAPASGLSGADIVLTVLSQPSPVAFGTVYNTIRELLTGGLLKRSWGSDGKAVYRLDDASRPSSGLRLSCKVCGGTTNIDDPQFDAVLQRLMEERGAVMLERHVAVPVTCAACQAAPASPPGQDAADERGFVRVPPHRQMR